MLLEHLVFGDSRRTDIYVDNKGHSRSKQDRHSTVNMRMHMLPLPARRTRTRLHPSCPTFDMVADYITKATPKPTHERHNVRAMDSQTSVAYSPTHTDSASD
jgi:hypothetical protein